MKDNSLLKMDHEDTHLGKVEIAPRSLRSLPALQHQKLMELPKCAETLRQASLSALAK